ncbi:MAG: potassium channel family protein [Bacteroidales bacterium]|jgi:voltage-gated potassium channel Kch|nr:potassium channel family protein [Bacteroidales bacterium]
MLHLIRTFTAFYRVKAYRFITISAGLTVLSGTIIYHYVEGWRWIDSFYFSVITLTTVGYGDLSPQTDFGKIFTTFYVIIGIGILLGFINSYYDFRKQKLMQIREERLKKRRKRDHKK